LTIKSISRSDWASQIAAAQCGGDKDHHAKASTAIQLGRQAAPSRTDRSGGECSAERLSGNQAADPHYFGSVWRSRKD
jgi:hypothetical protein